MAGYFGVEIILGVGVNWLGQTYVFAQASEVLGEHIGSPLRFVHISKKAFGTFRKPFLIFYHSIILSLNH